MPKLPKLAKNVEQKLPILAPEQTWLLEQRSPSLTNEFMCILLSVDVSWAQANATSCI